MAWLGLAWYGLDGLAALVGAWFGCRPARACHRFSRKVGGPGLHPSLAYTGLAWMVSDDRRRTPARLRSAQWITRGKAPCPRQAPIREILHPSLFARSWSRSRVQLDGNEFFRVRRTARPSGPRECTHPGLPQVVSRIVGGRRQSTWKIHSDAPNLLDRSRSKMRCACGAAPSAARFEAAADESDEADHARAPCCDVIPVHSVRFIRAFNGLLHPIVLSQYSTVHVVEIATSLSPLCTVH